MHTRASTMQLGLPSTRRSEMRTSQGHQNLQMPLGTILPREQETCRHTITESAKRKLIVM
jgi:hypothetical protein